MNEEQVSVGRRRSRQEVEQVVAEYESSGLSRIEFCRQRGLALSTLGRYRKRRERQAPTGSSALLAVEVSGRAPAPLGATGSALVVLLRGGRRIEVGRGFDTGALEQLVRRLGRGNADLSGCRGHGHAEGLRGAIWYGSGSLAMRSAERTCLPVR